MEYNQQKLLLFYLIFLGGMLPVFHISLSNLTLPCHPGNTNILSFQVENENTDKHNAACSFDGNCIFSSFNIACNLL